MDAQDAKNARKLAKKQEKRKKKDELLKRPCNVCNMHLCRMYPQVPEGEH